MIRTDEKTSAALHKDACIGIRGLLKTQHFAVLATEGNSYPHASIVAFAHIDNGTGLLFITPKRSRKYRNIRRNPNISLVIDSRPDSSRAIGEGSAVTLGATACVSGKADYEHYAFLYSRRHPSLRPFLNSPDFALIVVTVKKYIYVNSLNTVVPVSAVLFGKFLKLSLQGDR